MPYLKKLAKVVTAPAAALKIMSQQEGIDHCRSDNEDDNAYVSTLIDTMQAHLQSAFAFSLFDQGIRLTLDDWPRERECRLPLGPVQTIDSVTWIDSAGDTQTVDAADYYLNPAGQPQTIVLAFGKCWPTGLARGPGSIFVDYTAGYASDTAGVPADVKHAAKLLVGHFFNNREEIITEPGVTQVRLALGIDALMTSHLHR